MSGLPIDLQRRCERRWHARFSQRVQPVASRKQEAERESQQIPVPDKSKRKNRAGLKQQCKHRTKSRARVVTALSHQH